MPNFLPAVLIGGPPHAGKSVLFYSLTQALRERGVRHHAIRACPDGEGNWSQECDPQFVSEIRKRGSWSEAFTRRICQDVEHRCLPFLIDMGGRPRGAQMSLFRLCTHAILLLREDEPETMGCWQEFVTESGLIPLASLISRQEGESFITASTPVLQGVFTRLERGNDARVRGPLFVSLVDRIATLFESYEPQELVRSAFEQAPAEVLDLTTALQQFDQVATKWRPDMLSPFLAELPEGPVAVYGAGPNWLYAGIAACTNGYPLFQYDPRYDFGWRQPLSVRFGNQAYPDLHIEVHDMANSTLLSIEIPSKHLVYFQPEPLCFPHIANDKGLILSGPLPFWLLTALVRLYKDAGVPWIAPYHVPLQSAVVAYSRAANYAPGDLIHANVI